MDIKQDNELLNTIQWVKKARIEEFLDFVSMEADVSATEYHNIYHELNNLIEEITPIILIENRAMTVKYD